MRVLHCETEGADVPLFAAEEAETLAETGAIAIAVAVARQAAEIAASLGPGLARSLGEVAVADADAGLEGPVFLSGRFVRVCFSCSLSFGLVSEVGK